MISFYLSMLLAVTAIVLATIVMSLLWERNRVARRQAQQQDTPSIWVRNSPNLDIM